MRSKQKNIISQSRSAIDAIQPLILSALIAGSMRKLMHTRECMWHILCVHNERASWPRNGSASSRADQLSGGLAFGVLALGWALGWALEVVTWFRYMVCRVLSSKHKGCWTNNEEYLRYKERGTDTGSSGEYVIHTVHYNKLSSCQESLGCIPTWQTSPNLNFAPEAINRSSGAGSVFERNLLGQSFRLYALNRWTQIKRFFWNF